MRMMMMMMMVVVRQIISCLLAQFVCLPVCTQLGTKRSHLHSAPVTPYPPHIFMINKKYSHSRKSNLVVIASCGLTRPEFDPGHILKTLFVTWQRRTGGRFPHQTTEWPDAATECAVYPPSSGHHRHDLLDPGRLQGCTAHSNTLDL